MIPSLEWTGQSLHDLANARVAACAIKEEAAVDESDENGLPQLHDLFDSSSNSSVDDQRLVEAFAKLRLPRRLSKFMYRLLVAHCQAHVDTEPVWQIGAGTFESQLALFLRDQDAIDQGLVAK